MLVLWQRLLERETLKAEKGVQVGKMGARTAGPGCHGGCGVEIHIKDGKMVKCEGDESHPF
ncbi:MAG: hypothetical protein Q8O16_06580, partial [Dehalococcoidia bacterium]|nr:hypothetical protein [Dehalococcoidia bacterium]